MTSRQPPSIARNRSRPQAQAPASETPGTDDPAPQGQRPAPLEAGGTDAFVSRVIAGFDGSFEALGQRILHEVEVGRMNVNQSEALRARLADFRATLEELESVSVVTPDHPEG